MIWRVGATIGALVPVASALGSNEGAMVTSSQPEVWHFFGYPFEVGSMLAGLMACLAVRFYVTQTDQAHYRWTVDMAVLAISLMFTGGLIVTHRPEPFTAMMMGTGIGALGAGIISIALKWVRRFAPEDEVKPG